MIVVGKADSVPAVDISDGHTVVDAKKRVLIGPDCKAPNFIMRMFTLGEGGFSPYHQHPWEHEVYVISGEGVVKGEGFEKAVRAGNFVYVPPNEEHQFCAVGKEEFKFICVIPNVEEG
jgi:quercetin dioxygenase-like cupin family protein